MNRRSKIEDTDKINLSRVLILPMIGLNYREDLPESFYNTYIVEDYGIVIVLDKNVGSLDDTYDFLEYCKNRVTGYVGCEDELDELCIFFRIPKIFYEDFDRFVKGKYSKFSDEYKSLLVKFFKKKFFSGKKDVTVYEMIYPEDSKRLAVARWLGVSVSMIDEVYEAPDLQYEIYKPLNILIAQNITEDKTDNKLNTN